MNQLMRYFLMAWVSLSFVVIGGMGLSQVQAGKVENAFQILTDEAAIDQLIVVKDKDDDKDDDDKDDDKDK